MTYSFSYLEPVCCSMSFFNCCFLTCIQISQEAGQMVWLKNWCFWTVVLEKTHESPLDCKEIQPVHPRGNQSWMFIGGTDVEAETPILWPPDAKSWLIWKDPDAGKDWRQEEKGTTEFEMVGWHHWFNGLGQTPRDGDRTGKPGVLQSIGSQRVRHNLGTEHQQHIQNN